MLFEVMQNVLSCCTTCGTWMMAHWQVSKPRCQEGKISCNVKFLYLIGFLANPRKHELFGAGDLLLFAATIHFWSTNW